VAEIRKPDLKGCDAALILLRRALAIDPYYAPAASHVARVRCLQQTSGVSLNAAEIAEALQLARSAIENGGDDPDALSRSADALAILGGDIGAVVDTIEHALALNPNSAATCWMYANLHCFANRPDAAIPAVERAMRLSPLDPYRFAFKFVLAHALMLAGRYGEAMEWVDRSLHDRPSHHTTVRIKVALCGYLGRADASEWVARLRDLSPAMTISGYRAFATFLTPAARAIWEDGLRRAGLPENAPRSDVRLSRARHNARK
jgi:adenylate cyclase